MKKKAYSMPLAQVAEAKLSAVMQRASWGWDGEHKPVIDGNPDGKTDKDGSEGVLDSKYNAWSVWEEDDEQ